MKVGSVWPRRGGHGAGDVPGALCAARGVPRACGSSSAAVWGSLELGLLCWGEGHAGLGPPHLPGPEPQVLVCGTQVLGPPSRQLPGAPGSLSRHSGGCGGRGVGSGGPWPVPTGPLPLLLLVLSLWPPRSLKRNLKPEPGLGPLPWRASGDPRPHHVAFRCRGLFTRGCAHGRLREASRSAEQGQGELKLPHRLPSSSLPRAVNSLCEERDKGLSRQGREQTGGRGLAAPAAGTGPLSRPLGWRQVAPGSALAAESRVPSPDSSSAVSLVLRQTRFGVFSVSPRPFAGPSSCVSQAGFCRCPCGSWSRAQTLCGICACPLLASWAPQSRPRSAWASASFQGVHGWAGASVLMGAPSPAALAGAGLCGQQHGPRLS